MRKHKHWRKLRSCEVGTMKLYAKFSPESDVKLNESALDVI